MNKYEIVRKIEALAPLETQESWDCSGWVVLPKSPHPNPPHPGRDNIQKVLFALTVTDDVVRQAREQGCDMIISHHPLFYVPLEYKDINIYCAHTNLDLAQGGTTDRLIEKLGFGEPLTRHFVPPSPTRGEGEELQTNPYLPPKGEGKKDEEPHPLTPSLKGRGKVVSDGFVRIVELETPMTVEELRDRFLKISPRLRYVNNCGAKTVRTIGFCAGSGSEFIGETDAFVTGDLKFHTALDAKKVVFDIGHFESEIFAPELLKEITGVGERGIIANEKSPFI